MSTQFNEISMQVQKAAGALCNGVWELSEHFEEWLAVGFLEGNCALASSVALLVASASLDSLEDKSTIAPRLNIIVANAVQRYLRHTVRIRQEADHSLAKTAMIALGQINDAFRIINCNVSKIPFTARARASAF